MRIQVDKGATMEPTEKTYPRWMKAILGLALLALLVGCTYFQQEACGQAEVDPLLASDRTPVSTGARPHLTEEERTWLREHPVIRVAQDPGWPPVEFADAEGRPSGISDDYLKLIERRLGVKFKRMVGLTWQQSFEGLKRWEIDMTPCVAQTQERTKFWVFTKPYMTTPIVILTHTDVTYIDNMLELEGKKVGVVEGYVASEWIRRDFPRIQLVRVHSVKEGLELLQQGEVFAFVDNMLVIGYHLAQLKLVNFKFAGATPYVNAQCMAVRKDWAPLAGILQKALDSISEAERERIYHKWVPIRYEHGVNYKLLWQVLAIFSIVLAVLLVWNRKLRREITSRKEAEAALRKTEQRYRTILETAMDGFWVVDMNGRILEVNEAYSKIIGYSREELLHMHIADVEVLEMQEDVGEHIEQISAAGSDRFETIHRRKDGSTVRLEIAVKYLPEEGGRMSTFLRDITEAKNAEKDLRNAEQRYRTVFENAAIGMNLTSTEGRYVQVNEPLAQMLGYSVEELLNMTIFDVTHPEDEEVSKACLERMVRGEIDSLQFEKRYVRKDGRIVWADVLLAAARGFEDAGIASIGAVTDITGRKQAEEALRSSESFLNSVIEQSPYPMWISDHQGTLIRTNQALRDLMHVTDEEIVGRYNLLRDNIVEEQGLLPQVTRVFEEGDPARFEIKYDSSQLKHIQLKEWASVILDVTIFPTKDLDGKITNAVIQHMDITERNRSEEALFQAKQDWEDTFNSIEDMITIHDKDFNIITYNTAAEKILGLPNLLPHDNMKCYEYYHGNGYPPDACPSHNPPPLLSAVGSQSLGTLISPMMMCPPCENPAACHVWLMCMQAVALFGHTTGAVPPLRLFFSSRLRLFC